LKSEDSEASERDLGRRSVVLIPLSWAIEKGERRGGQHILNIIEPKIMWKQDETR
jgi:hypothetical protein